jgi:hypothetical protein
MSKRKRVNNKLTTEYPVEAEWITQKREKERLDFAESATADEETKQMMRAALAAYDESLKLAAKEKAECEQKEKERRRLMRFECQCLDTVRDRNRNIYYDSQYNRCKSNPNLCANGCCAVDRDCEQLAKKQITAQANDEPVSHLQPITTTTNALTLVPAIINNLTENDNAVTQETLQDTATTPAQLNAFSNRPAHEIAPVIPFKGDIVAARRRLQEFINKSQRLQPLPGFEHGCLIPTGCRYPQGQGTIFFEGKQYLAHCFAWMVHNNREIPEGFKVLHNCRATPETKHGCPEPTHLRIGTHRENMFEDKLRDGTLHFGENHHSASITNEKALAIYNSKGNGTCKQRAARFGVNPILVTKIDSGERWGHVTGHHKARIKQRERAYQNNRNRSRADATQADYEKAMKRIEAHNYPSGNAKGCTYSTYCRDICGYPLIGMLGHQTRCSIVTYEYHHGCKIKPAHLWVLHYCDDEHCTNNDHLYLDTPSQNQLDRWARTGFKRKFEEETSDEVQDDNVEKSVSDEECNDDDHDSVEESQDTQDGEIDDEE